MKTPQQLLERDERLMESLQEGLRLGDGLMGDLEYVNSQVVTHTIVEGAKPRVDPKAKGRFSLVVETSLFGGRSKHIDAREYARQTQYS